ncbi:MAG: hypothetical protein GX548_06935 [Lentisphaerae bacterium]|nr:hypothetical protein [Lentisphaerota bacterium]
MKHSLIRLVLSLPLLMFLGACATTPAQRIQQNQEMFDALPVADQARIRGGEITIGYTPDMVRIALGEPQRKLVRRTAVGETRIWLYTDTFRHYERQRADIDGLSLSGPGGMRSIGGSAWINILQEREIVRTRVEFQAGTVFAIEETAKETARP